MVGASAVMVSLIRGTLLIGLEANETDVRVLVEDLQRSRRLLAAGEDDGAVEGGARVDLLVRRAVDRGDRAMERGLEVRWIASSAFVLSITVSPQPTTRTPATSQARQAQLCDAYSSLVEARNRKVSELWIGFRAAMRFYEYEARKIVELAGIPVTKYGFCTTAEEAREAAEEIGGPVVIKSQVLSGGRMKAGGVKFADTPEEAAEHAEAILKLEINGHMPRGVLVDPKAEVKQEYYAGVVWDGTAKRPLMLFSDMGGIDIEEVAETPPRPRRPRPPLQPAADLRLRGQAGDRRDRRHRLAAEPRDADPRPPRPPLPRQRHDAGRDQPAGRADRRQLRRPRRPHGDGERGGRPPEGAAAQAARDRRGRHPRDLRALRLRAQRRRDRRRRPPRRDPGQGPRLRGQPRPRDRRRRRLADPDRRGPQPGRQARQLLRDRRQPLRRQGLRPGQGGAAKRTASRRSR